MRHGLANELLVFRLMRNDRLRRILVIAGCSSEGRLTTPKLDGAEVKISDRLS
jgi:hypothetical protein